MDMISISVRKEVVQCSKCREPKSFLYLSDYAYGERLVFSSEGLPCAFARHSDDTTYVEYEKLARQILWDKQLNISEEDTLKLIIETFGITCDEINKCKVDFSQNQKKCSSCGSINFESKMIEPETFITIELPLVSHNEWNNMDNKRKYDLAWCVIVKNFRFNDYKG